MPVSYTHLDVYKRQQYIFPYFVCMLPGAAAGLSGVLEKWSSENMGK